MLATAAIVEAVAAAIEELELPLVVVDPVLVSTSGARLLDDDGVQGDVHASCCRWRGSSRRTSRKPKRSAAVRIDSLADARDAARRIHEMGAAAVIITGGHGPRDQDQDQD